MAKKEVEEIAGVEGEATETRVYELGFHLDPELPQEEVKKSYESIRERIAGVGTIIAEGQPTKIPLAYTISRMDTTGRRDFDSAFFSWIAYETTNAGHEQISTMAREETRIIRFLDIRSDEESAKHSAEIHEIFEKAGVQALNEDDSEEVAEVAPTEAPEEVKESE